MGSGSPRGGRLVFDPAVTKLPDILARMARGSELIVAGDIAIVTGRLDVNVQKFMRLIFSKEQTKGEHRAQVKARGWSSLLIDWRRYLYFEGLGKNEGYWNSWVGVAGYDGFSMRYFQGQSQKAWKVASSLLTKDEFAELAWGKCKHTNVKEEAEVRAALMSGTYKGHEGQILFAAGYYSGNLRKAYYVARSLLSNRDYDVLGWSSADALSGEYDDEAFDLLDDELDTADGE